MRRWAIGTNNYYFTSGVYLEEAPWYVFTIENIVQSLCHYFPPIPLPSIKITREGGETTLKDYYGTTRDLFHIYVCERVYQWCWEQTDSTSLTFPYLMLKGLFPESFKDDGDFDEQEVKENFDYSKKVGEEFDVCYKNLNTIYEKRNI